jgi:hypothetical protein
MSFPRFLFAQAIINIPAVMVYGLFGGLITFRFIVGQEGARLLDVYFITLIFMIDLSSVTGIIASVFFFMKSKYSYNALLLYTISTVIPNIVIVTMLIIQTHAFEKKDILILGVFSLYPFWLLLMSLRPYHIRWARAQGKMSVTMFNPKFMIPLLLCILVPFASSFAINKIGIGTRIEAAFISFTSSSTEDRASNYNIANAHDEDSKTVWIPQYGKGTDQWIRINIAGEAAPVAQIRISSDNSGKYGRAGSVLVETSAGDRFVHELKNTAEEQSIPVKEKKYTWIKITFKSVYPGRENIVSVAEISLHAKKREIVNMLPEK